MSDEITIPSGPFVWWGRQVARVLAPSAGLGAVDRIGASIVFGHILAGAAVALAGEAWAFVPLFVIGLASAGRYMANCQARQAKMIRELREEHPDMEVVKI